MPGPGHGRGFRRGQRRGGRQGGGQSLLSARMMEPALLAFLSQSELHGYNLMDMLAELGLEVSNPSVVYRTLRKLEDIGMVKSNWESEQTQGPPRRIYALTEDGHGLLRQWQQNLHETRDIIDAILTKLDVDRKE